MPKLTILKDGQATKSVPLEVDTVQIGSAEGNTIRIKSPEISREHCEIRRQGMQYRLVDLESKTGTKVNGSFVNQHLLEAGDEIELGPLRLRFERDANGVARPAAPSRAKAMPPRSAGARPARPAHPARPARPTRAPPRPRSSAGPAMALSAVVAVGLVLVAVFALRGKEEPPPSKNELLLLQMEEHEAKGRDREALALASMADRAGDPEILGRIDRLAEVLDRKIRGDVMKTLRRVAQKEGGNLLIRAEARRGTPAELLEEMETFLSKYGHLQADPIIDRVRERRRELRARVEGGAGDVAARWQQTEAQANALVKTHRFQDALDEYGKFLDENLPFIQSEKDLQQYQKLIHDTKTRIEKQASQAWRDADDRAKNYLARGKRDHALRVYRLVLEKFGLPVFEEKAAREIKAITGR